MTTNAPRSSQSKADIRIPSVSCLWIRCRRLERLSVEPMVSSSKYGVHGCPSSSTPTSVACDAQNILPPRVLSTPTHLRRDLWRSRLARAIPLLSRKTTDSSSRSEPTASEDRNHVCHMPSARPQSQSRQAPFAKAYTEVPGRWSVFLLQRRRWTLEATSNDLMLVCARGVQWCERNLAFVHVLTWFLNRFNFASIAAFIFATTRKS